MHRKSMEAAETLKNDDSGGSDREDSASKASDSSMHSPHSRTYGNSNGNGPLDNNNQREQNNNKISMGNHNSAHSPVTSHKEHHRSPTFRSSPGPVEQGSEKPGTPMGLPSSHLPPPAIHNGKPSVLSPPPPALAHHHHHMQAHAQHHHNSHPLPLHSHLMHPGMSPNSSTRTTPPTMPSSMGPNSSPSPHAHLMAHHPNGMVGLDVSKAIPNPLAPTNDPEAFRWVNSYREPISIIR